MKATKVNYNCKTMYLYGLIRDWVKVHRPDIFEELLKLTEQKFPRRTRNRQAVNFDAVKGLK